MLLRSHLGLACVSFCALVCALSACGGNDPGGRGRTPMGTGGAAGQFSGAAGVAGTNPLAGDGAMVGGGFGGSGAAAGTIAPPPVDPTAPPFVQDDTSMSGLDQGTIDMLKAGGGSCT